MNVTSTDSRLTPAQVEAYRREGYLIYDQPVLPQEKFTALKDCFEKILADLPTEERPEAMDVPHFMHPELFEWAMNDAILDLVEPVIGPDIALFSTHFICKPKGNGRRVPWHEDSAYWKGQITPMEVVTVWLALDPSLKENGCMMVIPATHRTGQSGFSDYNDVDAARNIETMINASASSFSPTNVPFMTPAFSTDRSPIPLRYGVVAGRCASLPPR